MNEFRGYDKFIEAKNRDLVQPILPLLSWEFYGEHFNSLHYFKNDLEILKRLSRQWDFDHNFTTEFVEKKSVVLVTSPELKIVYASHNIQNLNGYTPEEVVGNSPKMFQGKDTCLHTSKQIREAVNRCESFDVSILNYKKDKGTYICQIKGYPIFNKKGKLVNYIAFEKAA